MNELGLRERNKLKRREAIVEAAYTLFAERGYDATTIADIADAAEVAPRTVSLYFPTKLDIALAGVDEAAARLAAALQRRQPGDSTIALFGDWLRTEFTRVDPEALERSHRAFARNPELRALTSTRLEPVLADGARAIAEELDASPDDIRVRIAMAALMGVLEYVSTAAVAGGIDETIDLAVGFLTAGLATLRRRAGAGRSP